MKALLDEIESMILAGNERTAQRKELMESTLAKASEIYSAIKKPSQVLKVPGNVEIEEPAYTGEPTEIRESVNAGELADIADYVEGNDVEILDIPLVCSCGKPWKEGAQFCSKCGAKRPVIEIIDRALCPDGHENSPGAKFCRICGKKIV